MELRFLQTWPRWLRAFGGGTVSFRIRRLEPFTAAALACATTWMQIVSGGGSSEAWVAAFAAFSIAAWSRSFPASHATLLLVRAAMLLIIAVSLYFETAHQGLIGPYFFWLPAIAVAYAMLLPSALAVVMLVLCLVSFGLALGISLPAVSLQPALQDLGLLVAACVTAWLFGRTIQRSEQQMEAGLLDAHSAMYNKAGLLAHGAELVRHCRLRKRDLTMVLLRCRDLGDVRELLGREAASKLFSKAVSAITGAAPRAGLVARSDHLEFVLMLPGIALEDARALVQSVLGSPPGITLSMGARKVHIVLDAAIVAPGKNANTVEELLDVLQGKLLQRRRPTSSSAISTKNSKKRDPIASGGDSLLDESGGPLSRLELSPTLPMALAAIR